MGEFRACMLKIKFARIDRARILVFPFAPANMKIYPTASYGKILYNTLLGKTIRCNLAVFYLIRNDLLLVKVDIHTHSLLIIPDINNITQSTTFGKKLPSISFASIPQS